MKILFTNLVWAVAVRPYPKLAGPWPYVGKTVYWITKEIYCTLIYGSRVISLFKWLRKYIS